ncbi:hypothetical protein HOO68_00690 [Candidatus Gracilibacteria bacterium]|nr:hypothetical protein [Candidatus Gracilibacteria bacterium]
MNPEVKLSDSEILQLSNAGHNEIADLASGNNTLDIKKLRVASQVSRDTLAKEISQIKITDSTRTGLQSLLEEAAKNPGVSQVATVASVVPSSGYTRGPLKQVQNPENDLEKLTGNEAAQKMGETIKKNITLLQTRVRTNYIRHFDDALLGSVVSFRDEYEHYGRVLTNGLAQIGTPGFTIDADKGTGDNVVNYSNTGASELIDSLVSQYGNGSKELQFQRGFQKKPFNSAAEKDQEILAKLQEINEGLLDEDGWLGLAIGLPIGLYITAKVTVPIMKWGIGKVPFVGKPAVALTEEMYEKIERAAKGVGGSGKSLAQSVKDRLLAKKAEGAGDKELSDSQKELKKVQTEGAKEVVKEFLFEKYGSTYSNYDAFIKDLDSGGVASSSQIRQARQEMSSLNTTISKHLPVDVSLMDGWELEMKLRQIGLDMPLGVWGRMKNTMYRFLFEKGAVSNLVFQNKYVRLSDRTNSGAYTDKVSNVVGSLSSKIDRVEIEFPNGDKIMVPRAEAKMIKEVMQHVDAQVAAESLYKEASLIKEIHTLEEEIKQRKAQGIPSTDAGLATLEEQLDIAKRDLGKYTALNSELENRRNLHTQSKEAVDVAERSKEEAKLALEKAQSNLELYNEYGKAKTAYADEEIKKNTAEGKVTVAREKILRSINTLESTLGSKSIQFSAFSQSITDANFTSLAKDHIRDLSTRVTTYNAEPNRMDVDKLTPESIFGGVNSDLTVVDMAEGELKAASTAEKSAKAVLNEKIADMTSEGLWDTGSTPPKPNTDGRALKAIVETKAAELRTAESVLTKAKENQTRMEVAKDGKKAVVKADPIMRDVLTNPKSVDATGKKTFTLKTQAELDAEKAKLAEMKAKLAAKGEKSAKVPALEESRIKKVVRTGVSEDDARKLKPKSDGNLDAEGQKVLDAIVAKATDTQGSFDAMKARLPAGYTTEIRDGKLVVKDSAGLPKGTLDPSKPAEAAKLLEKLTKR